MTKKKTLNAKKTLVKKTIVDLVADLKHTGVDVAHLEQLQQLDKDEIYKNIKDSNSDLFKAINSFRPILLQSDSGKKYLEILTVLNKDFQAQDQLPDTLHQLLSDGNNSELMSLAQELMSNTELASEIQGLQQMDMANMMNLFNTVGNFVKDKTESGELDLDKLSSQATEMFSNIQSTPEIHNILQENPQLGSILRTFSGGVGEGL